MFRAATVLTRTAVYLAVLVYALLPGATLAECGCPDCACFSAEGSEGCCCSGGGETPTCCLAGEDGCKHCDTHQPAVQTASCHCHQHFTGHEPVPQNKRSETTEQEGQSAPVAELAQVVGRPQSGSVSSIADRDPTAHAPPIHLMNCVWRN